MSNSQPSKVIADYLFNACRTTNSKLYKATTSLERLLKHQQDGTTPSYYGKANVSTIRFQFYEGTPNHVKESINTSLQEAALQHLNRRLQIEIEYYDQMKTFYTNELQNLLTPETRDAMLHKQYSTTYALDSVRTEAIYFFDQRWRLYTDVNNNKNENRQQRNNNATNNDMDIDNNPLNNRMDILEKQLKDIAKMNKSILDSLKNPGHLNQRRPQDQRGRGRVDSRASSVNHPNRKGKPRSRSRSPKTQSLQQKGGVAQERGRPKHKSNNSPKRRRGSQSSTRSSKRSSSR